jgi:hypothetical protein
MPKLCVIELALVAERIGAYPGIPKGAMMPTIITNEVERVVTNFAVPVSVSSPTELINAEMQISILES